jgi:hypothetical protein
LPCWKRKDSNPSVLNWESSLLHCRNLHLANLISLYSVFYSIVVPYTGYTAEIRESNLQLE